MLLRGKDLQTGKFSKDVQEENLEKFRNALDIVMNLNLWHNFLNLEADSGYLKSSLISSDNAVVFSYLLFLIGKTEYKVSSMALKQIIQRWIFMANITGYYTDSPESKVEKNLRICVQSAPRRDSSLTLIQKLGMYLQTITSSILC